MRESSTRVRLGRRRRVWAAGFVTAVIVAAVWLSLGFPIFGFEPPSVFEMVAKTGPLGPLVSVALMTAHTLVPFPAEVLVVTNAIVFGPVWGAVVSWVGALLGAALGFGLSRRFGRPLVQRWFKPDELERFDRTVARYGTGALLGMRLLPVLSFNLVNYAAGLTAVRTWAFAWTTAAGTVPWIVAFSLGGDQLLDAVKGEWDAIGWLALIVAVSLATGLVARRWGKVRERVPDAVSPGAELTSSPSDAAPPGTDPQQPGPRSPSRA